MFTPRSATEGVEWIETAPDLPPRVDQLAGALRVAADRDAMKDVDVLRRSLPVEVRRWGLRHHLCGGHDLQKAAKSTISDEDLEHAAMMCEEDVAAPRGLLWQLAASGRVEAAIRLADKYVADALRPLALEGGYSRDPELGWPFPIQAVVLGLARAGQFAQALELAKLRLADTDFRGNAIAELAYVYIDRNGPDGAAMFLESFNRKEHTEKAGVVGHIAGWKAMRGDPAVVTEARTSKGMVRFCVQTSGFAGYLRGNHVELGEAIQELADSTQAAAQRGVLAAAWAKRGDVDKALSLTKRLRGEGRDEALAGIFEAVLVNDSIEAAERFAQQHVRSRWLVELVNKRLAEARRAAEGI
jgi:hypothetical protein